MLRNKSDQSWLLRLPIVNMNNNTETATHYQSRVRPSGYKIHESDIASNFDLDLSCLAWPTPPEYVSCGCEVKKCLLNILTERIYQLMLTVSWLVDRRQEICREDYEYKSSNIYPHCTHLQLWIKHISQVVALSITIFVNATNNATKYQWRHSKD